MSRWPGEVRIDGSKLGFVSTSCLYEAVTVPEPGFSREAADKSRLAIA